MHATPKTGKAPHTTDTCTGCHRSTYTVPAQLRSVHFGSLSWVLFVFIDQLNLNSSFHMVPFVLIVNTWDAPGVFIGTFLVGIFFSWPFDLKFASTVRPHTNPTRHRPMHAGAPTQLTVCWCITLLVCYLILFSPFSSTALICLFRASSDS